MQYSIKHLFHIDAPKQVVFKAISSIEGLSNWWTIQTKGETHLGGTIQFDFGETVGPKMEITKLEVNQEIEWKCIASHHGWESNTFVFLLDDNDGKTRVRFSHNGWKEQNEFYGICNFSWGRYLLSLRQYCETGKGVAFGSLEYK
ncbi:SRPBCC domain-containing protein [Aquimarina sp. AU474]|uniref:SRPBCC family protein n=1 Tax=Aquimarina sp. AU474 TaxID=2108529 RepID=UPI0013573596|nr:SRPBCC domain-containing protein [Aquimarina sp. AU474]